jgi:hypothetical protein
MINNFLINRVLTVTGFDGDDNILYRLTQPQNVSLSTSSETAEVVDALGTPIAVFDRSKSAELSGENAIFDLSLLAEQHGTEVKNEIDAVPCFEKIKYEADKEVTLAYAPIDDTMVKIYALNDDSSIADALTAKVAEGKFTMPVTEAKEILVSYERKPETVSVVTVSSDSFATAHKIVVEILGCDVCNTEDLVYAYLIMENAKMSSDTGLSFGTDLVHSFTVSAQVSYCSPDKRLFYIVIPEDTAEAGE